MAECGYYPGICLTEKDHKNLSQNRSLPRHDSEQLPNSCLHHYLKIILFDATLWQPHTHDDRITQFIPSPSYQHCQTVLLSLITLVHTRCTCIYITLAIINIIILIALYYYLLTISCDFFFSMEYRS